ncbi:negative regulator of septation ring formation [Solibacillus silvestris StLB046]|uniref:Negative regulator of septation ring formation n=1 Tax=Solibacillus silvestris (strain StLB046) TaxID=1002809 RepID=F2FA94_SOLSS|nr:DUF3600 domain-containing protein [Solibacillus silvestris]BAK16229.1 negative regulator of septation ring formation [Solibacillus silvestris StLB046]
MGNHFKQDIENIEIPFQLHERSKKGIQEAKSEMGGTVKHFVKKRIAITIMADCLMVPTGAFAYQSLLADDLYGSFDNVKKHIANITIKSYLLFDAKLSQAKGDLGNEQFEQFKEILYVITDAKLEFGDKNGNIDYSKVSEEKLEEIKAAIYEIQPYFDKLNNQPSSKEILTAEEYEQYIQALLTFETVMAKLGVSSPPAIEMVPEGAQEEFLKARAVLDYVNEKQMGN